MPVDDDFLAFKALWKGFVDPTISPPRSKEELIWG